jgi:hypothetical protein
VLYKGYYSAVKIWPQSQPEPFEWTATSSPTMTNNYGQTYVNGAFGLYFSGSYMPKLMGISAFGSVEDTPVSVAFDQDTNGWYHSWPFEDPGDGNVYAISWGQYANNNTNGSPSHGGGIAWGYFGPDHGRGVPSSMGYQIQSLAVREPPGWDNVNGDPNFRPYAPSRVKITGKIHVSMGRSQGIDSRDQYPTSHSVTTVITVFNYAPGQPYWLGEPYWKPLGRDVLYQQHNIDADGPASIKPFEFEVYSDYWSSGIDIDSLEDGAFAWGVSMWDPLSKMREMDSRGGPFMLPNVGSFNVSVSEVVYWGVWDTIPCGTHFCMAAAENGGVEDQRTCEGVPIDSIKLHELYTDGQVWSVVLQKPFVPGTVTVTVDGMPAKPALDFIESSPSTGVIMFLNSFLNAKEMTVCYIPDEGGNTETDPITYARPGGAPVPV